MGMELDYMISKDEIMKPKKKLFEEINKLLKKDDR